ncbi:MAG TPA: sugar kinase [Rhodanobacteraceae bacterium]|nr:sugar kinase [Rhodanobacteraceae bacterium]
MRDDEPAKVVCFGELLMRLSPPADELLLQSPRLEVYFGGAEGNVAVSLAVLGQRSTIVSTLPAGPLGAACVRELRRQGVDVGALREGEGRLGVYFLVPGAQRRAAQVVYDRTQSAFALAPAGAYDWPRLLTGAGWLHLSGIDLAVSPAAAEAALAAVRVARERGVKVSFDCNFRPTLWGARLAEAPDLLREAMAGASLAFAGAHELAWIVGGTDDATDAAGFADAAQAAFARWPRLQRVATTGHVASEDGRHRLRGLLAQRGAALATTPAYAVDATLGRVGSGDAFAAGILYGLLRGHAAADTLAFATAAACLKYGVPGDANLLDAAAMHAFAASRPGAVVR